MSVRSSAIVPSGGSGTESRVFVIHVAVPRRANTAPKMLEVAARNSTIAVDVRVASQALRRPFQVKRP